MKKNQLTPSTSVPLHRRPGFYALVCLAALVLAYITASLAIDSGRLLEYGITILLLYTAVRAAIDCVRAARKRTGGQQT